MLSSLGMSFQWFRVGGNKAVMIDREVYYREILLLDIYNEIDVS